VVVQQPQLCQHLGRHSVNNSCLKVKLVEKWGCCGCASICNKEPCSYSLTHSPSQVGWGGESEGKKAKTHWEENSLTEWQREKKTTINNTDKKQIQHAVLSPPDAQLAPE